MAAPCFRGISIARKRVTFVTEGLGGSFETPAVALFIGSFIARRALARQFVALCQPLREQKRNSPNQDYRDEC
jgi:hypothetical protein